MLTALQTLPRDAELLAFEAGCEDYCEREVDEVEWQGGRVYLHPGARHDPRQATGSGQWVGPASPWWATIRKQRPGNGEKASAVVGRSWHGGRIRKGDGGGETGGAVPVSRSRQRQPI